MSEKKCMPPCECAREWAHDSDCWPQVCDAAHGKCICTENDHCPDGENCNRPGTAGSSSLPAGLSSTIRVHLT